MPVTPEDVLFTYEVFTKKSRPSYSVRTKKIAKIEKTGGYKVKFTFNKQSDREFSLKIAITPIIPKHAINKEALEQTTLKPIIGSGPHSVAEVKPGERRIVYERNLEYWAHDIPAKRGLDNYDQITIEYFLNAAALFEAFKRAYVISSRRPIR